MTKLEENATAMNWIVNVPAMKSINGEWAALERATRPERRLASSNQSPASQARTQSKVARP